MRRANINQFDNLEEIKYQMGASLTVAIAFIIQVAFIVRLCQAIPR
jgi:hypothetical protein